MTDICVRTMLSIVLVFGLITGSGCAYSQLSKFYTLRSVTESETPQEIASQEGGIVIAVGPVSIPDYLDRPQIVTRSMKNELFRSEYSRWGGSLADDIQRVLSEDLSLLLTEKSDRPVSVIPWRSAAGIPVTCRIAVHVTRFEGTPGEGVSLRADWSLLNKNGRAVICTGESSIIEKIQGDDYPAIVESMSRALGTLSRTIVEKLKTCSSRAECARVRENETGQKDRGK